MDKKERRQEINNLIVTLFIALFIGVAALLFYIGGNKSQNINYNEKSNVDYQVNLKKNDFFKEESLGKNKGYVASLIDIISADFEYDLDFSKETDYNYSYRIAVEVDVEDDKNNSNIYHFNEDLISKKLVSNSDDLKIKEKVNVKYSNYNNLISRFKEVYDLRNVTSNLNLVLYVTLEDVNGTDVSVFKDHKVSSLTIPLTENTVSIDIGDESVNNTNKIIELPNNKDYTGLLVIFVASIIIAIAHVAFIIIYSMRTKTAQMVYEKEIKSILNNYDSYIQKISNSYDLGTSQVLKIDSFNDMLEIRDTLKQPILMLENEQKNGTFFIIPATNSIIYTYALRVIDIKAKMEGKEIPTYDITEIPHADFKKKKRYTDEFIKEQLTMTTAMPVVDDKNVIKGTKSEEGLYDQLEKTSSFDIKELRKAKKKADAKSKTKKKVETKTKTTTKKKTTKK
ncbi:MAG: hypothetical protein IKE63_05165 [Bacilli bacterium]|nr:hypothetical protein [Bacilli bacterium]